MKNFKFFPTLIILYVVIGISSLPLGYKLIQIGPFLLSAGALFVPFRFMLGDILSEVYGYKLASKQILNLILSSFIFSLSSYFIIRLPSPPYWHNEAAFQFVLGHLLYITTVAAIGILIGSNINMYIVSKLKYIMNGKYFILRSFVASITGELTQYIIVISLLYFRILSVEKILELIINDYLIQLILLSIAAVPSTMITYLLKKHENIDNNSIGVKFNPFIFEK
jgi:uncharacterized integral membrane protein (TIGR00697 family)